MPTTAQELSCFVSFLKRDSDQANSSVIEGHGKVVLYTGDIRSEPWWVNSIARNPSLVEYTFGLKTLDRIYLDTSMLDDITLQTKSQGLQHLLSQVVRYPQDTIFCMQAWTFGYEEVWIALSKALQSKIHVDGYKMRVYQSLVQKSGNERFPLLSHHSKEAPYLVGFSSGRKQFEGCLTCDENVRIHSCEKDTPCDVMRKKPVVWIRPVVALLPNGEDMNEVGLGGGGDDLEQEVDLAQMATDNFDSLLQLITESRDLSIESKKEIKLLLMTLVDKEHSQNESVTDLKDIDNRLGGIFGSMIRLSDERQRQDNQGQDESSLPRRITFPYARHSAYPELRHLVETFRPKDVWPNTVDLPKWAERDITMRKLFGASCSGTEFQHDLLVQDAIQELRQAKQIHSQEDADTQTTASLGFSSPMTYNGACGASQPMTQTLPLEREIKTKSDHVESADTVKGDSMRKCVHEALYSDESDATDDSHLINLAENDPRHRAFESMTRNLSNETWQPIHLISTTDHHTDLEAELGHQ